MITINKKEFITELEWAQRFTEHKNIPILSTVLLQSSRSVLFMAATDLEVSGKTFVHTGETEGWSVAVNVKTLLKYLKKVDESEVRLTVADKDLTLHHGESDSVTLEGMDAESFPVLPVWPEMQATITGLDHAIPRVLISISDEESRFTLNGALLRVNDNSQADLVSTDGHRLSKCEVFTSLPKGTKVLIPRVALFELERVMLKNEQVGIAANENHLFLRTGKRNIIARKLAGNFPDYERVMPKNHDHAIELPVKEVVRATERVAIFADERSHCATFKIESGVLSIAAGHEAKAKNSIKVNSNGTAWTSGFNSSYILEGLKLMDTAEIQIKDGENGINTMAAQLVADRFTYVVMPMRL